MAIKNGRELLQEIIDHQYRHQRLRPETLRLLGEINSRLNVEHLESKFSEASRITDPKERQMKILQLKDDVRRRYNRVIELAKGSQVDPVKLLDVWATEKKNQKFLERWCRRPVFPCWRENNA